MKTIKEHPGYTTKQFNRLLFDTYGARVRELDLLFGCRGLSQLIDGVSSHDESCEELKDLLRVIDFGRPAHRYQVAAEVARVVPSGNGALVPAVLGHKPICWLSNSSFGVVCV